MTIAEMKARLDQLKADASAILDKVEADDRTALTDAEQTRFDGIKAEIDTLDADIAAAERLAEMRREMAAPVSRPALSLSTDEPNPATTGGFRHLAEFAIAVREAVVNSSIDRRLMAAPTNVHQGTGADGEGFLIPSEFRDEIWNAVRAEDDLLSRFTVEPTAARSIQFVRDETTPWGASGITAVWRAEAGQMTPDKIVTKASRLEVHDLAVFAAVTDEMLADAPRLNAQLTTKAAQAIRWKAGEAVIWGDGTGKPLGIMSAGSLVTVAKESGQAADTIVAANVNKMYSRRMMTPGDRPFWLANIDIFPQLQTLGFGSDSPLFYPPAGITTAPNGTLLGYPIVYSEHAATLGDTGDLILISPAGYMAVQRAGGLQFASSIHLWFDYNIQAFRWTFRMGGQPLLSAAISPARGTATKSHFVALADRA